MSRRKNKHRSAASAPAASFLLDTRKNLPAEQRTLIANARNDITIPFYSGVLQHADETLIQQGGGKGLAIYDEIERDTHAYAMLQKRKKTLTARAWEVQPGGDRPIDKDAALLVEAVFTALPFDRICEDMLDATLKGYAVSESVWTREGDYILPRTVLAHDQRRFVFDEAWAPRLLTWTDAREGIALPDRKFLVHRYGVKGNNPYGLGLGTRLFWAVLFKREGVAFWAHFLEKFAGPTIVGKTPYGTLTDEQNRLLNTLVNARTASAITVPIGTDVEMLEASRSGSVTYEQWLAYWDRQISICVTGETLTTQVGESGGNRALGEVHQEMLEMLVDSDADLLSETLRDQLIRWIVDYNLPGAALPTVWRPRPKNEDALASTRQTKAVAAEAVSKAIRTIVAASAEFDDDEIARDYILSFEITDQLSDRTIEALLTTRHSFGQAEEADALAIEGKTSFTVGQPKKKSLTHRHICFAEPGGTVEQLTDAAVAAAEAHFRRRVAAIRKAVTEAEDFVGAGRNLLELAARWTPDALARLLAQALDLAGLEGREAAFADGDEGATLAEPDLVRQEFAEQIAFLTQKRGKPTRAWTDAMHGDHDRAFVVAGVTDMAMLEEFHAAVIEGARTYDIKAFSAEFDRLVEKYGWSYNGGRSWRIRTIFETNIRTSYMAGRLKQMRDPDMVKLRPFWMYRHADTRVPKSPRPQHVAFDGLVLAWDDPWWTVYFPPNDWVCSCGVHSLSRGDLRRMGKTGPDPAPEIVRQPHTHEATGVTVQLPEGTGYGWDHMPGDLWERGLVPSALIEEGGGLIHEGRHAVIIDQPSPLADLVASARAFKAEKPMAEGLDPEEYAGAFLKPFGADLGRAVLWQDPTGTRIPISEQFFRDPGGAWKGLKRGRGPYAEMMAETIMDPDEIWLGVSAKPDPIRSDIQELLFDRRYIRVDPKMGFMAVLQIGRKWWEETTVYPTQDRKGNPDVSGIQARRGGKLIWKRK